MKYIAKEIQKIVDELRIEMESASHSGSYLAQAIVGEKIDILDRITKAMQRDNNASN